VLQVAAGDAVLVVPDLPRRAAGHDPAAGFPAAGAHIDDIVGVVDHVQIVLNDDNGRTAVQQGLENAQKQADSAFEQAAVDKAAENTTVDMPKALVENELDIQMERFGYQLQMSGYSMEQYAKMMGGDVSTMRNAFRPAAEKQAKISVTLEKIAEVEGITASDEDIEAEFKSLAEQYELEVDKVKEMVPMDELTGSIKTRKAIKVIVDSAVPVAPKAEEKTEE